MHLRMGSICASQHACASISGQTLLSISQGWMQPVSEPTPGKTPTHVIRPPEQDSMPQMPVRALGPSIWQTVVQALAGPASQGAPVVLNAATGQTVPLAIRSFSCSRLITSCSHPWAESRLWPVTPASDQSRLHQDVRRNYASISAASLFPSSTFSSVPQPQRNHAVPALSQPQPPPSLPMPTSSFPPIDKEARGSTLKYPFPIQYYQDREVIVYSMQGQAQGVLSLPGDVFTVPVRVDLLHRVVRWLRATWQQGTHKAKRRGEVSGGGKKPWPQKGTGRSRHGSIRSPIWVGGGAAHGPIPRSHAHDLPLPLQLMGYKCALSAKANEGRLVVVDSLVPQPVQGQDGQPIIKTGATEQQLLALLKQVPHHSALLVDSGEDALDGGVALRRGARNLPWLTIMPWQKVTVYHLLKYQALVITKPAAAAMAARLQHPPVQDNTALKRMAWLQRQQRDYQHALQQLLNA